MPGQLIPMECDIAVIITRQRGRRILDVWLLDYDYAVGDL